MELNGTESPLPTASGGGISTAISPVPGEDAVEPPGYQIRVSLTLPRDRLSVPIIRHLAAHALSEVGVVPEFIDDVELAVSEACGNVVDHSGPGDAYEVNFTVGARRCEIRVVDVGRGFDSEALNAEMAPRTAERGRGIALMHSLMDTVRFEPRTEKGTVVYLVKALAFDDDAPARRLLLDDHARRGADQQD